MINYNIREKKFARIFLPREKNTRKYAKKLEFEHDEFKFYSFICKC